MDMSVHVVRCASTLLVARKDARCELNLAQICVAAGRDLPVASAEVGLVGYQSRWRIDEEMQWDHPRRHPFATVTHRLLTRVRVRVM